MKKYYVIITALLVSAFLMIGCAKQSENVTTVEETVVGTTKTDVADADMAETTATDAIVTESEETTEEIQMEEESYYIPEGVDLESSLVGEEWLKSFIGVVEEPVVVIYSDVTGRKDIVHDGDIIHINPDEDMIAHFYSTESMYSRSCGYAHGEGGSLWDYFEIDAFDPEIARSVGRIPAEIIFYDYYDEDEKIEVDSVVFTIIYE